MTTPQVELVEKLLEDPTDLFNTLRTQHGVTSEEIAAIIEQFGRTPELIIYIIGNYKIDPDELTTLKCTYGIPQVHFNDFSKYLDYFTQENDLYPIKTINLLDPVTFYCWQRFIKDVIDVKSPFELETTGLVDAETAPELKFNSQVFKDLEFKKPVITEEELITLGLLKSKKVLTIEEIVENNISIDPGPDFSKKLSLYDRVKNKM